MQMEVVVNRIHIAEEAVRDFRDITHKRLNLPIAEIRQELNDYLEFQEEEGRLINKRYLRVRYCIGSVVYLLFIYRKCRLSKMQIWQLAGICRESDWSEELEDDGYVRTWLKTKTHDLPDEEDWVVRYNEWQEEIKRQMEK